MASYNHAAFVGAAIESVLEQTYQPVELIVCDDGSTDESADVIQRYADGDRRVQLIRQRNQGPITALNAAYERAHGDILCLLDSDDFFARDKLRLVVEGLRPESAGLLIHAMTAIDRSGRPLTRVPPGRLERGWLASSVERRGGRWGAPPTSAICLRRDVAGYAFPLPLGLGTWGTDDLFVSWLLALLTPVVALDSALTYYRIHGANMQHGRRLDAALLETALLAHQRVGAEVNRRLAAVGFAGVQLDLSRNVTLRQDSFFLDLVRGTRSRRLLAREYASLIGPIWGDDVVGVLGRLRSVVAIGLAVLLPVRWRPRWLTEFFSQGSRLRLVASAALRVFRPRRTVPPPDAFGGVSSGSDSSAPGPT